ncbi:MbtH family protein [Lysinibacillus sp. NPDC096418]|uniref:MbtH family protein n=1 Tax=Lysinibacillus sp. NPDC096418 TaxID=3364138 RepID=UPI0038197AF6
MTNPFEEHDGVFFVLANNEGQHSLWPAYINVPSGWDIVYGENNRQECVNYIQLNWKDIKPSSLKK